MTFSLSLQRNDSDFTHAGAHDGWTTAAATVDTGTALKLGLTFSALVIGSKLHLNTGVAVLCDKCDGVAAELTQLEDLDTKKITDKVICAECTEEAPLWRGVNPYLWLRYYSGPVATRAKTLHRFELWLARCLPDDPLQLTLLALDLWEDLEPLVEEVESELLTSPK